MDTQALRQKILDLAIRGKLVPQDPNDEPASVLLECIRAEKQQMVKEGKLKAKDIKNDTIIYKGEDNLHYEKFQDGTVKCIEDEVLFEVPEGWTWCRLRNICMMSAGKAKPTAYIKTEPFEGSFECYGGNGVRGYVDEYNYEGIFSIVGRQGALCGNINIASGRFYATEHAVVTTLFSGIDFLWSNYILEALELNKYATGAAQPGLSVANVLNIFIAVPPENEQKQIAKSIKSSLENICTINAKKNQLQESITQCKSKILDLAISGKLIPQDPTDEPASVLLERIRAEKEELIKKGKIKRDKNDSVIYKGDDNSYYEQFANNQTESVEDALPFKLPDGWEWTRLGAITDTIQYGLSNSAQETGTHRLLRITDIQDGKVDWDSVPFTTTVEPEKFLLHINDIVFARTGATVGKSFLITEQPYPCVYASYLIRIRMIGNIFPQYIYQFFNSLCYWIQITEKSVGVGQPNCNGTSLKELFIPLPPIQEQYRIVDSIENTFKHLDHISKTLS